MQSLGPVQKRLQNQHEEVTHGSAKAGVRREQCVRKSPSIQGIIRIIPKLPWFSCNAFRAEYLATILHEVRWVSLYLRVVRKTRAAPIATCALYHIPVIMNIFVSTLMQVVTLIIEHLHSNDSDGVRVMSSNGGVAGDAVTVVQAREYHEYRTKPRSRTQGNTSMGLSFTPSPGYHLFFVQVRHLPLLSTTIFTFCCVTRIRGITRVTMARAFSPCSREGTTSFSRR